MNLLPTHPSIKTVRLARERIVGFGIARLYEELMEGAAIEVRAFHYRKEAADWLGVPEEILLPTT